MFELVHSKGIQRYQIDPSLDLDTTRKSLEIIADAWVNRIMEEIVNNDYPYFNDCKELQDMMTTKTCHSKNTDFSIQSLLKNSWRVINRRLLIDF